jgi:hypothetical protein
MMKILIPIIALALLAGFGNAAYAQTIEMSVDCDRLQSQILELIKTPDARDAQKIKEGLGVDILMSCDLAEGSFLCFQCIDKTKTLRTLQVLKKKGAAQFDFLGFGCRCREQE